MIPMPPKVGNQDVLKTKLEGLRRSLELTDRVLSGRGVKLVFNLNSPNNVDPAVSRGDDITINLGTIKNLGSNSALVNILGLNYHEVAHVRYGINPRIIENQYQEKVPGHLPVAKSDRFLEAYQVLEEARVETLLSAKYAKMKKYFSYPVVEFFVNDDTTWGNAFLYTHGRRYLPRKIRDTFRQIFEDRLSPKAAQEFADLIDQYRILSFRQTPGRRQGAALINAFALLLEKHQMPPLAAHQMDRTKDGRSQPDADTDNDAEEAYDQTQQQDEKEERGKDGSDFEDKDQDAEDDEEGGGQGDSEEEQDEGDEDSGSESESGEDDGDEEEDGDGDSEDGAGSDGEQGEDEDQGSDDPGGDSPGGGEDDGSEDGDEDGSGGGDDPEEDEESDSSGEQDHDDGDEDSDDSGGEAGDRGDEGGQQQTSDSGSGVGDGGSETPNFVIESPEELANELMGTLESVLDSDEVRADIENFKGAMDDAASLSSLLDRDPQSAEDRLVPVTADMLREADALAGVLRQIWARMEPGWEYGLSEGNRIDMNRAASAQDADDYDSIYIDWNEGQQDNAGLEVVVLADKSSSMLESAGLSGEGHLFDQTSRAQLLSKQVWEIMYALQELEATVTVLTFNHYSSTLYDRNDRVTTKGYANIAPSGGTNPRDSVLEARRILTLSEMPNKLLVAVSDGEWGANKEVSDALEVMTDVVKTAILINDDEEDFSFYHSKDFHVVARTRGSVFDIMADAVVKIIERNTQQ